MDVVCPAPREAWAATCLEDPDVLPTQQPAWTDAVCAGGRFVDASRLYHADDGRRLVLPMVRRRIGGSIGVEASMPTHWGFGGLIGDGGVTAADVRRRPRRSRVPAAPAPEHPPQPAPRPALHRARAATFTVHRTARACPGSLRWCRRRLQGIRGEPPAGDPQGRALGVGGRVRHHGSAAAGVLRAVRELRGTLGRAAARAGRGWRRFRTRFRDTIAKWETIARHLDGGCRQWVARHEGRPGGVDHRAVRRQRALHAGRDGQGARRAVAGERPAHVARHPGGVRDRCGIVPPG